MKANHNLLGWLFPFVVAVALIAFVHFVPAVGLAPAETFFKVLLRVAVFMAAWTLALRFLGGVKFSVTESAKHEGIRAIHLIACAIIIGLAMVISK